MNDYDSELLEALKERRRDELIGTALLNSLRGNASDLANAQKYAAAVRERHPEMQIKRIKNL